MTESLMQGFDFGQGSASTRGNWFHALSVALPKKSHRIRGKRRLSFLIAEHSANSFEELNQSVLCSRVHDIVHVTPPWTPSRSRYLVTANFRPALILDSEFPLPLRSLGALS